jgi:hypothetical protein
VGPPSALTDGLESPGCPTSELVPASDGSVISGPVDPASLGWSIPWLWVDDDELLQAMRETHPRRPRDIVGIACRKVSK